MTFLRSNILVGVGVRWCEVDDFVCWETLGVMRVYVFGNVCSMLRMSVTIPWNRRVRKSHTLYVTPQ